MATSKQELEEWFDKGVKEKHPHMLVVCDTFDWSDYPVYVKGSKALAEAEIQYNGGMQKVMEIYNLKLDQSAQMNKNRNFER